ncbi:MAG: hypothetical protein IPN01_37580 [Deltaproteobacteria bacterium]|nr:hypothetical protein [Deltaproteobacteria bacterium]
MRRNAVDQPILACGACKGGGVVEHDGAHNADGEEATTSRRGRVNVPEGAQVEGRQRMV